MLKDPCCLWYQWDLPNLLCWTPILTLNYLNSELQNQRNMKEPKHELDFAYAPVLHVIATLRLNSGTGLQMKPTGPWAYHKPFSSDESLDWFKGKKRNALCFMGKATVSCRLSLKPIHWVSSWNESFLFVGCLGCAAKVRIISPVGWKWQSGGLGLVQKSPIVWKPRRWYNPSAQSYRAAFPQWVMISNKAASKSPYNHHVWFESFDLLMYIQSWYFLRSPVVLWWLPSHVIGGQHFLNWNYVMFWNDSPNPMIWWPSRVIA